MICLHAHLVPTQDFNPEKYEHLLAIFGHTYLSSASPVNMVPHFLSVFTIGQTTSGVPETCEPFIVKNYDIRKAYVACSFKGKPSLAGQIETLSHA